MGKKENKSKYIDIEKATRINFIFGEIKKNSTYEGIYQELQNLSENYTEARGEKSVLNVKKNICSLPLQDLFIKEILETQRNSFEDVVEKHDLRLISSEENIGVVGIQVKSSIYHILDFYKELNEDYFKAKEVAIERKLIILNGQLPDDIIIRNFYEQFGNIRNHCKMIKYPHGQSL